MNKTNGKFITLEGCEGVGKSTQIRLLQEYCLQNNIPALFTREPGGTKIAEKIRQVILDKDNSGMNDITELLLYAASRREHTANLIIPALQESKIVFCDRYTDSTLAYQGYGRGIDLNIIKQLNTFAMGEVKIDYSVFLDLPPKLGFERKGGRDKKDRIEQESADFFDKVYKGFLAIKKAEPQRFLTIDAKFPIEKIHEDIVAKLKSAGVL
ncbi:MAG: dTMP kinase [Firmicutes bacterium]|nr:dTMP kinase [Bacillota bacterium]